MELVTQDGGVVNSVEDFKQLTVRYPLPHHGQIYLDDLERVLADPDNAEAAAVFHVSYKIW
jgi:hypothetical protein